MNEYNECREDEFISKFIKALGENISANKERKIHFAQIVYEEIQYFLMWGIDQENFIGHQRSLQCKAEALLKAIDDLLSHQISIRMKEKSLTRLNGFVVDTNPEGPIIQAQEYTQRYVKEIRKLARKKNPGVNNITALTLTTFIAKEYKICCGNYPSFGKSEKIGNRTDIWVKETPFDRICNLIARSWDIKIADSTKKQALKKLR